MNIQVGDCFKDVEDSLDIYMCVIKVQPNISADVVLVAKEDGNIAISIVQEILINDDFPTQKIDRFDFDIAFNTIHNEIQEALKTNE